MTDELKLRLPFTRVKKICKLDPSLNNITLDAVKLLALATEKYVELLAQNAANWALANSRKTVNLADIEQCIQRDWLFAILEGALTDWPEEQAEERNEQAPTDATNGADDGPTEAEIAIEEEAENLAEGMKSM